MLFIVLLPKLAGCAQLVVLLAQRIPVRLNNTEDTFVLLPNPRLSGHPPTEPAFIVAVKNHSEPLNGNVSAVAMWSWSKRS